jgi:hypothetical protein
MLTTNHIKSMGITGSRHEDTIELDNIHIRVMQQLSPNQLLNEIQHPFPNVRIISSMFIDTSD